MSAGSPEDRRRSISLSPTENEDLDFQYALKLSAELNGDLGGHAEAAAAAAKRHGECDNDIDSNVQKLCNDKIGSKSSEASSSASSASPAAPHKAKANTVASINDTETTVEQATRPLSDFLEYLKASQCADCGGRFLKHESDATHIFQEWYEYKAALSSLLRCETCGVSSCITCSATPFSKRSLVIFDNRSVSWCCTDGRLLVIWILLCGFDVPYCEMEVKNAEIKAELQSQPTEEDEGSEKSKGKGKAESSRPGRSGVGYGGSSVYSQKKKNKTQSDPTSEKKAQMLEVQQAIDRLATTVLSLLENLLPSSDRGHAFDMGPPAMITDMLLESRVLDYFVDLLLHDSLDEVSSRSTTYSAVLDFVKALSTHNITANSTVFSRRRQRPELCNLLTQTYRRTEFSTQKVVPSIVDCLRERTILGDLQLKNAEQYKAFCDTESDQEILSHCRQISEIWKSLGLHVRESTPEAEGSNTAQPVVNISDVDDDQICASHAFAGEAREQNRSAPGRFKRLVSEINILKSSLPRTIFVRHGESRLDVMKCVIIGAEDTPYENGIFEFDMYCPAEYPKNPPQVSFKGTDGGKHGINPNLYPDGKVCLSLLGTWPGQPWDPVQSTLLQVLVSIQAMVLCEQPWYNEPGREHAFGYKEAEVASEAYNRRIRELTVEIAMINWLEKIPTIWEDVVKRHFHSNADKILRTVTEWSGQSRPFKGAGMPELFHLYHPDKEMGYRMVLPKLHKYLQGYGATVGLPEFPEEVEAESKLARMQRLLTKDFEDFLDAAHGPPSEPGLPPSYIGPSFDNGVDEIEGIDGVVDRAEVERLMAPMGTPGDGEQRFYSYLGRGQSVGAGPSGGSPAPSGGGGRGRGRGMGHGLFDWLENNKPKVTNPFATSKKSQKGKGKEREGSDDKGDGGRDGGLGRGGSSKANTL